MLYHYRKWFEVYYAFPFFDLQRGTSDEADESK